MQLAYRSILAFFLTPLLFSNLFAVDLVPWHTDLEQAFRTAKQQNRPLLLHFWRTHCTACEHLESAVFSRQEVATTLGSYYVPVKINATQNPSIAAKYRVSRFPTDVILTPNKEEIHRMMTVPNAPGYVSQISAVFFRSGIVPNKEARSVAGRSIENNSYANEYYARQNPGNRVGNSSANNYTGNNHQANFAPDNNRQPENAASRAQATQQEVMNPYANRAAQTSYSPDSDHNSGYIENTTIPGSRNRDNLASYPRQQQRQAPNRGNAYNSQSPAGRTATIDHPPVALDGYCPVSLLQNEVWKKGDPSWGVVHRGRTYLFSSKQNKDLFYARPDHFSPVLAGIDPVELADRGKTIEGKRAHGVVYKKRVYLFANEQNLERFWKTPDVFADQIMQAMVADGRRYR